MDAETALQELMDGNRRFVDGTGTAGALTAEERRNLAAGQRPIAVILGCSDSRVPVEFVFDQGPGRLFVVRVAGNIVDPTQTGSVEYAVEHLGASLVIVLGHASCGAVTAAVDTMHESIDELSSGMRSLLGRIRPALRRVNRDLLAGGGSDAIESAVRANVIESVEQLRRTSDSLAGRIESGELRIAGAVYSLESGEVDFLDVR
jgi:carbonic anhydrase